MEYVSENIRQNIAYQLQLNHLNGQAGLKGWQWMFLVQGLITCVIGIATYFWIIDFPENAQRSFYFLNNEETLVAVRRIQEDRGDVKPAPFTIAEIAKHFLDPKIYGFAASFFFSIYCSFILPSNNYACPIVAPSSCDAHTNKPYYYAVIPVLLSSRIGDRYRLRAPIIFFNSLCLIAGFAMLGFANQVAVRYIGTFLATGAYISNWAALNSYQANNITGQWKRAVTAAAVTACNGLGGVAGAFIVRQKEAPRYITAIWVSIGSHLIIMAIIAAFTLYFFYANRRQRKGRKVIEGTDGFRYTY
ncbi:hypothetical protein G7Y79_00069g096460 [Physcia stellaris]|nr:hypothetical protein G7Y79_00069g096460 [Physcia stellaris]